MHKIEVQFSQNLARFAVSLFTREWIEISSGRKNPWNEKKSPSLRGSGLKFVWFLDTETPQCVSLFTREWIEINPPRRRCPLCRVSLFTREWIEIYSIIVDRTI